MEWMFLPFKRYADFNGRSRRMEYWMYQLFTTLVYVACFGIIAADFQWDTGANQSEWFPGPAFMIGAALAGLWYVITFVPDIAVTVRRFHDQDLSGWLYLIRFIPYIGIIAVAVFMFIDGQRHENKFGYDPKDPHMGNVFD